MGQHQSTGKYSTILGGSCNSDGGLNLLNACTSYSNISGGVINCIDGMENEAHGNVIGGGTTNCITALGSNSANYNIIAGGGGNCIQANSSQSNYSFIGGGNINTVSAGYASIVGGANNSVSGAYSAILGGNGNSDGGLSCMGIYGSGIIASALPLGIPSGFWANELIVPSMPMGGAGPTPPTGLPIGALWYYPDALGNNVVYKA